jgi:uncharacterized phiE125 gp8 family phage protein
VSGIVVVTSASTAEPVTRTEAKLWLRIDEHTLDEDPLIDSLITRARQRWEDVTRRSAMIQAFDLYPDIALEDGCPITIPKAPLVSVTAIRAFADTEPTDTGGTAMSTSGYYVDTAHEFGRVMPLSAFTYPTATREINPVIIRFTAGYSTSSTGVPETAKAEIKQLVARLYEHRGDEVAMKQALDDVTDLDLPSWG